jgi:hypothetical protein
VQRLAHLRLNVGDEAIGFERQVQRLVIRGSLRLEVGRHVVVRVPVAIGADHPDFLAPQLVTERVQDTDLVGDPVDARPPFGVLLDDRLPPEPACHAVDRHVFVGGEGVQPGVGVPLQEVEGLDHRAMAPVVRAEVQDPEDLWYHSPVMALVRVADHGAQGDPVGRSRDLGFLDQVAQGLFADDREHDLAHDPVWMVKGGPGQLEEEPLLAADALQVVEQLAVDTAFGPCSDPVDGLGEEVDQVVGYLAAAEVHEGREPSEAHRFRVPAQLVGGLDRDTPPIPLQLLGKHPVAQVGGQPDPPDQFQPGQLGLDAGEARPSRIATQLQ